MTRTCVRRQLHDYATAGSTSAHTWQSAVHEYPLDRLLGSSSCGDRHCRVAAHADQQRFTDRRGDLNAGSDIHAVAVRNENRLVLRVKYANLRRQASDGVGVYIDTDRNRPGPEYVAVEYVAGGARSRCASVRTDSAQAGRGTEASATSSSRTGSLCEFCRHGCPTCYP
jgi:hypothetical protein